MYNHKTILLAATFFLSCSTKENKAPEEKSKAESETVLFSEEQVKNAGLAIGPASKQVMNAELKVNGVVDVPPQNMISVSFPAGGYLKSTKLMPGMHVSKGEVIAVMEDQSLIQLQQDYLIAKTKLELLKQEFERQQSLYQGNVNAEKVFQQARAEFESQKVLVKGFNEKLRLLHIDPDKLNEATISRTVALHSPINGFVSKVNVNIGKFVNPADVLFELINPDDIHAALTVFEKDMDKVRVGQQVLVSFVDDPLKEYACEVILVTRNVDEHRSGTLHCHFHNKPKQLLPGMFVNARIRINTRPVLTLPEEAIVRYGNDEFAVEATDSRSFRLLKVKTGLRAEGIVEIEADSSLEQKKFVVKNAYAVLGKMKNTAEED
jgi:cobalt-zinc-cadmium efflux system membrane fusion protein